MGKSATVSLLDIESQLDGLLVIIGLRFVRYEKKYPGGRNRDPERVTFTEVLDEATYIVHESLESPYLTLASKNKIIDTLKTDPNVLVMSMSEIYKIMCFGDAPIIMHNAERDIAHLKKAFPVLFRDGSRFDEKCKLCTHWCLTKTDVGAKFLRIYDGNITDGNLANLVSATRNGLSIKQEHLVRDDLVLLTELCRAIFDLDSGEFFRRTQSQYYREPFQKILPAVYGGC
jgi:hypothetical protein